MFYYGPTPMNPKGRRKRLMSLLEIIFVVYRQIITPTVCEVYLSQKIAYGAKNNKSEVKKLQNFLNNFEGAVLKATGIYDLPTLNALKDFQTKYSAEILAPWGFTKATGIVFTTTIKEINEIYCGQE